VIVTEERDLVLVIMEDGEDLLSNLKQLRGKFESTSFMTVVTALGMLKKVEMGYWNGKEYEVHSLKEPAELLGISGIITPNTDPFFHFHITLGTKDGTVAGGHLLSATVCNTVEMVLFKGNFEVKREKVGNLKLLRLKGGTR